MWKCNEINSENWKKAIVEFKPNRALKTCNITHVENDMSERNHNVPFGEEVTQKIINGVAIAAADASVQNDKIGEHWMLSDKEKIIRIEKKLHHKK